MTGWLTLISLEGIDREKRDSYELLVEACDNRCTPAKSNRNQTLLRVQIQDANDQRPIFTQPRYDFLLRSDLKGFTGPAQVLATDSDQPNTANSNVTYEIVAGNLQQKFRLHSTSGKITLDDQLHIPSANLLTLDLEQLLSGGRTAAVAAMQSLVSPVVNLTVRAYDHGVPLLDAYVNAYFHHQVSIEL